MNTNIILRNFTRIILFLMTNWFTISTADHKVITSITLSYITGERYLISQNITTKNSSRKFAGSRKNLFRASAKDLIFNVLSKSITSFRFLVTQ